ncbi:MULTISPECIES: hypothetical protein [Olivibacter]|uniref:Endosialidase-like protein n=1 Tax=Olivibacter oleidegradans TaxID=760123 RepID=A0ABV6HH81_9SPHI|nr:MULTISPECIES: hypothetical protein [Olivibacter]QEL00414.1 hypothetical protein FKG96_06185 [Olivibacter sp. LS-1]
MIRNFYTLLAVMLLSTFTAYTQVNIPMVSNGGPAGAGSWILFQSGNQNTSIQENFGINIYGDAGRPVRVRNTNLMVGYGPNNAPIGNNLLVSGKIGLGTLTPEAKLHIDGNIYALGSESRFSYQSFVDPHSGAAYGIKVGGAGIAVRGKSVFLDNVGIGTTNPQAKLAVEGNILAKEIKVKTDISVPDYVFEPDYKMLSLSEVEDYVKTHKHLPEIPSAKEISKEGLNLGAMNLLLLKKVEELTLHLIEKDKALENQQSLLDDVLKRLQKIEQQ